MKKLIIPALLAVMLAACSSTPDAPEQVIAVGDGANDLKMMQEASVSVAYKAKPTVRRQATIAINEGGLDRLLEVLPL